MGLSHNTVLSVLSVPLCFNFFCFAFFLIDSDYRFAVYVNMSLFDAYEILVSNLGCIYSLCDLSVFVFHSVSNVGELDQTVKNKTSLAT